MKRKILAVFSAVLLLCICTFSSFALGSGEISTLVGGHNGISIIFDDTHSFCLDNRFALSTQRYRWTEHTYNTFNGSLEGYIYPPSNGYEEGAVLRTEFFGLLPNGQITTINFTEFRPLSLGGDFLYQDKYILWSTVPFSYDLTAEVITAQSTDGQLYERTIERWGQDAVFVGGRYVVELCPIEEFFLFDIAYKSISIDIYQPLVTSNNWVNIEVPICSPDLVSVCERIEGFYTVHDSGANVNILDKIVGWLDDFLSIDLFGFGDVMVSLGDLLGLILALSCAIWILKLLGGG